LATLVVTETKQRKMTMKKRTVLFSIVIVRHFVTVITGVANHRNIDGSEMKTTTVFSFSVFAVQALLSFRLEFLLKYLAAPPSSISMAYDLADRYCEAKPSISE
jgi:hypothetical protein